MSAVLVCDVGGTNARIAVAIREADGTVSLEKVARRPVSGFRGLEEALEDWRGEHPGPLPAHAVFALAGPTGADEVHLTNAHWTVRRTDVQGRFGFQSVTMVNDFAGMARSVPALSGDQFEVLFEGEADVSKPIVVLGPGTGLGLATLLPLAGGDWRVMPSEGGHQAYAPRDARERRILDALSEERGPDGHVGFEDLVSGPGLERLYRLIARLDGKPAHLPGPPEIGRAAAGGDDPLAVEAAEVLALSLATFAGNAVLATDARGGCVLAGGVSEALASFLRTQRFRARFAEHGVVSHYFDKLPLRRVRDGFAALRGAALFAPADS